MMDISAKSTAQQVAAVAINTPKSQTNTIESDTKASAAVTGTTAETVNISDKALEMLAADPASETLLTGGKGKNPP